MASLVPPIALFVPRRPPICARLTHPPALPSTPARAHVRKVCSTGRERRAGEFALRGQGLSLRALLVFPIDTHTHHPNMPWHSTHLASPLHYDAGGYNSL